MKEKINQELHRLCYVWVKHIENYDVYVAFTKDYYKLVIEINLTSGKINDYYVSCDNVRNELELVNLKKSIILLENDVELIKKIK